MTLKNLCKIPIGHRRVKQRRRSGLLSPIDLTQANGNGSLPQKATKSKEEELVLYHALVGNEFLLNVLSGSSLQNLIDCMYLKPTEPGELLLEQGKINSCLFVSNIGTYEVTDVNEKRTEKFEGVRIFGELAYLHSSKAPHTIKALTKGFVWVLDCMKYKNQIINSRIDYQDDIVDYLKEVPNIGTAAERKLYGLIDIMEEKSYPAMSLIIKEGELLDYFFLVISGSATVLTRNKNSNLDKLTKGCFFGDYAFVKESSSLHTIIADPPGVECLLISRRKFLDCFHDLEDFIHGDPYLKDIDEMQKFDKLRLKDLKVLQTLGIGGFGKVQLVQHSKRKDDYYALKLMKKYEINGKTHIEQVYNEKQLQMACNNEFIVRLYKTFRDTKYVYFLLEPCLGGDLWNLLRRQRRKCFDTDTAKFYAGCILEALNYLHSRDIVYRDLKPENVMVAANGYLKLTDFGFAKKIGPKENSCSFVGTAEYVAPELIRNLPHDKGVDYWALGIFIFELLVGKSPFRNDEHNDLKTYEAILKGIDFVTFPYIVSPRARNLIKKLCRPLSVDRIGCQKNGAEDIQTHPWFSKFSWEKLRKLELEPPIRISLSNKTDTRYFENFKEETEDVREDFSTWDKDF